MRELLQRALDALDSRLIASHLSLRQDLREALAAPQAEPTADLYQHSETGRTRIVMRGECTDMAATWDLIGPLFLAAPPAAPAPVVREPLTDDFIWLLWTRACEKPRLTRDLVCDFARAIEGGGK